MEATLISTFAALISKLLVVQLFVSTGVLGSREFARMVQWMKIFENWKQKAKEPNWNRRLGGSKIGRSAIFTSICAILVQSNAHVWFFADDVIDLQIFARIIQTILVIFSFELISFKVWLRNIMSRKYEVLCFLCGLDRGCKHFT